MILLEIFWTMVCAIGFLWGLNLVYHLFTLIGQVIDFLADQIYLHEHTY